jgi:hypothetical protein
MFSLRFHTYSIEISHMSSELERWLILVKPKVVNVNLLANCCLPGIYRHVLPPFINRCVFSFYFKLNFVKFDQLYRKTCNICDNKLVSIDSC